MEHRFWSVIHHKFCTVLYITQLCEKNVKIHTGYFDRFSLSLPDDTVKILRNKDSEAIHFSASILLFYY